MKLPAFYCLAALAVACLITGLFSSAAADPRRVVFEKKHSKKQLPNVNVVPNDADNTCVRALSGTSKYANCEGVEHTVDIQCTGLCSYTERYVHPAEEKEECVVQGSFDPSTHIRLERDPKGLDRCYLQFVPLTDSCTAEAFAPGLFGVTAEIQVDDVDDDDTNNSGMLLRFSINGGGTFYNAEEPRKTIPADRFLPSTRNLAKDLDGTVDAHHRRLCSDVSVPECESYKCYSRSVDGGRKCCEGFYSGRDAICMLNGDGNACKCGKENESNEGPCYVDLRCNQNTNTPVEIWENNECRVKPKEKCGENKDGKRNEKCTDGYECRTNKCFEGHEFCIEDEDPKNTCKLIELPECSEECIHNKDENGEWQNEKKGKARVGLQCCKEQHQEEKCILNQNGSTCNCRPEDKDDPCYIEMRCNGKYEDVYDPIHKECRYGPFKKCLNYGWKPGDTYDVCTYGYECIDTCLQTTTTWLGCHYFCIPS